MPWAGRELHPHPFAGDTGQADPGLRTALQAVGAGQFDPDAHARVIEALRGVRVYAPVLPHVLEQTTDDRGLVHDNFSEMAMVRLASDDGRECTPCFTDIPALTSWGAKARPVPIEAERMAAAAIEEGAQLLVIDPGGAHPFLVRRTALWAFVQGNAWIPAWADESVAEVVGRIAAGHDWIDRVQIAPGSGNVQIAGPEVAIILRCPTRPTDEQLAGLRSELAGDEDFIARVDSLVLHIRED